MWVGIASPVATTGLKQKDNGVCIVDRNTVRLALSEERISRIKHDHGVDCVLEACSKEVGLWVANAKSYGISSCSDLPWAPKVQPRALAGITAHCVPSHHYSHALSAFHFSPFQSALVLVIDAGGNIFSSSAPSAWWSAPREQTTLWLGQGSDVCLLERVHFAPFEAGYGEWFRAITHYLGWTSHTLSGNTMALAAFGVAERICKDPLFEMLGGAVSRRFKNNPSDPTTMVHEFLKFVGRGSLLPRAEREPIGDGHRNLASYLQWSLERSTLEYLTRCADIYGAQQICITGGVAQNCVLNAKVAAHFGPENVYVCPFAGDVGQCVGNALFARARECPGAERIRLDHTFWGLEYDDERIRAAIRRSGLSAQMYSTDELVHAVSRSLAAGRVVSVMNGRSEFGPRALGHRSVLCDPTLPLVVERVKRAVKCRDEFMPLAPVIHWSMARELETTLPVSGTMVYAPVLPAERRPELGATMHVDGTARIQALEADGSFLARILDAFYSETGRRALVNTSFNRRGAPMVESPEDALEAFVNLDIDSLALGNHLLEK